MEHHAEVLRDGVWQQRIPSWRDLAAVLLVLGTVILLGTGARQMVAPFAVAHQQPEISLSSAALPAYTLRTVLRMLAAFAPPVRLSFARARVQKRPREPSLVLPQDERELGWNRCARVTRHNPHGVIPGRPVIGHRAGIEGRGIGRGTAQFNARRRAAFARLGIELNRDVFRRDLAQLDRDREKPAGRISRDRRRRDTNKRPVPLQPNLPLPHRAGPCTGIGSAAAKLGRPSEVVLFDIIARHATAAVGGRQLRHAAPHAGEPL